MGSLNLEENVPLAPLTTLGVGGPARYLAGCPTPASLVTAFAWARERGIATFVLGGGSNLVVSDDGFDGLVVRLDDDSLSFEEESGFVTVRAGAGVDWDALVAATVDAGLAGLECLSGIPGLVGAAPIQNVGAYGQEVSETITAVHALERATGDSVRFAPEACGFGYRRSRFKGAWEGRYAVVRVDFRLPRRPFGAVRYADLERRFGAGATPPLAAVRETVLEVRRSKSMVIDPEDPNRRSAGSFFTNPVVTPPVADDVRHRLAADDMPVYPAADGRVKLSAAWLIERVGFRRGERLGRAAISTRHSLALVNLGGATAAEIVALARRVRAEVRERTGVVLVPEPVFLGFAGGADLLG